MIKRCKYCNKDIEFEKSSQFGAHIINCNNNPNLKIRIAKIKANLISKNPRIEYNLFCKKCGESYILLISEKNYVLGKYKKHCSLSCANGRIKNAETRNKISNSLKIIIPDKICLNCQNFFKIETSRRKNVKFCSVVCQHNYYRKNSKEYNKDLASKYKGIGNPMYGKSPGHSKCIKFHSEKNNRNYLLRSPYEEKGASLIESNNSIKYWEYESIRIEYINSIGNRKTYVPDFKFELNDQTVLVEVKPKRVCGIWGNPEKFEIARLYCKERNWRFEVWTEEELGIK